MPIRHGVYRYAEESEILLFSYAIDDGPVHVADITAGADLSLLHETMLKADEIVFHNSMFDRAVLNHRSICVPIEKWRDTMVAALAHSLPGALDKLCTILNVPHDKRKLDGGKRLIQLFCKPLPKNQTLRRATRETHPAEWKQFVEYATADVEAMRYIYRKLPRWNLTGDDLALWHLDQRINDRGMAVDVDLARASLKTVEREKKRLADRTAEITGGDVGATTQRDKLLEHLLWEHGVDLPDMKGDTLDRQINDADLPEAVRELMANRLQASSTSPAKYKALINAVNSDGRLRGTTQFRGAGRTGRSAGRVFQPQNLMRVPKHIKKVYDEVIDGIKADGIDLVYENAIEACAAVVRGAIVPGPGKKFVISDLSNIEGRKLAWLAGEEWKLEAFREKDAGRGHDLYALGYSKSFKDVTPEQVMADDAAGGIKRQVGKVQELMLGYQGSVGAYVTGAQTYGIDLALMADLAFDSIEPAIMEKAVAAWEAAEATEAQAARKNVKPVGQTTYGLTRKVWTVCHSFVTMWRQGNPNIVRFWWALQDAVREAIDSPGMDFRVGRLVIDRKTNWLRIRLPSGRFLCYPNPKLSNDGKISYRGMNQYTKRWQRIDSYGGKFAENVTQASAGDLLWAGLVRVEDAGFEPVLHVHDEVVSEVDIDAGPLTIALHGELLRTIPSWAPGLPLAAGAYEALRYRKED